MVGVGEEVAVSTTASVGSRVAMNVVGGGDERIDRKTGEIEETAGRLVGVAATRAGFSARQPAKK